MILVTGWSGNTGTFVVRKLLERFPSTHIVGISRSSLIDNDNKLNDAIIIEHGDLSNESWVEGIFKKYKFEFIIHIANIRYSPLLLKYANMHHVKQTILIHTTGVYSKYRSFSKLYSEIEQSIITKNYPDTNYTILRPTMIYGNSKDHNMHKLIRYLSKYPIFPIFGNGESLMQPVHVEDLANAIISTIDNPSAYNEDFDLSGGTVISYNKILNLIINQLNKRVIFIYIPIPIAVFLVYILSIIPKKIVTVEQVKRLQEDKVYSNEKARTKLLFSPMKFEDGIVKEIEQLREEGLIT